MKITKAMSMLVLILIFSGCTAIQNHEVAKIETFPDTSSYEYKPSVYIDANFFEGDPDGEATPLVHAEASIKRFVENVIVESELFSSYTFDPSEKNEVDYVIDINIYNHGNKEAAFISGFITGFSLFVIPGAATDHYTLSVKAVETSSHIATEVRNKDSVTTWFGIWFLPMVANTPGKAIEETLENQIRDAIRQLVERGNIQYSLYEYDHDATPLRSSKSRDALSKGFLDLKGFEYETCSAYRTNLQAS